MESSPMRDDQSLLTNDPIEDFWGSCLHDLWHKEALLGPMSPLSSIKWKIYTRVGLLWSPPVFKLTLYPHVPQHIHHVKLGHVFIQWIITPYLENTDTSCIMQILDLSYVNSERCGIHTVLPSSKTEKCTISKEKGQKNKKEKKVHSSALHELQNRPKKIIKKKPLNFEPSYSQYTYEKRCTITEYWFAIYNHWIYAHLSLVLLVLKYILIHQKKKKKLDIFFTRHNIISCTTHIAIIIASSTFVTI